MYGWTCLWGSSLEVALELLDCCKVDCYVLDLQIPQSRSLVHILCQLQFSTAARATTAQMTSSQNLS